MEGAQVSYVFRPKKEEEKGKGKGLSEKRGGGIIRDRFTNQMVGVRSVLMVGACEEQDRLLKAKTAV